MNNSSLPIKIFTDGSCHTQLKIGAWAALIFYDKNQIELKGTKENTTHNAMELLGVIEALLYIQKKKLAFSTIEIITDSQYVIGILRRKDKLTQANFLTKKNKPIRNKELVKQLIAKLESLPITLTKIKAHQKKTDQINYNRFVDQIARAEVRKLVRKSKDKEWKNNKCSF